MSLYGHPGMLKKYLYFSPKINYTYMKNKSRLIKNIKHPYKKIDTLFCKIKALCQNEKCSSDSSSNLKKIDEKEGQQMFVFNKNKKY